MIIDLRRDVIQLVDVIQLAALEGLVARLAKVCNGQSAAAVSEEITDYVSVSDCQSARCDVFSSEKVKHSLP